MSHRTLNGIHCPEHPQARLRVTDTLKVAPGIVRRYRACSVSGCAYRVSTEERPKAPRAKVPS